VSLLKAFYGDAATKDNDFAFNYLPKIDRRYSWAEIWDDMLPPTPQDVWDSNLEHVKSALDAPHPTRG
jgi:hypothetical protein